MDALTEYDAVASVPGSAAEHRRHLDYEVSIQILAIATIWDANRSMLFYLKLVVERRIDLINLLRAALSCAPLCYFP